MTSELVERAIVGDESAITQLYNETYQTAYSIAVSMLKDENEAFDILQEAYISAFNNLKNLQDKSKFNSWFNHIVSNKCKDYFRKKKPDFLADNTYSTDEGEIEVELEDKNLTFSPEESVDYGETKRLMAEMLNNLPDDQRMVILMYYMQDMSIKEIAEILDVSENTVKSRMNYGKKKLKSQVEDLEKKGTKLYGVSGIMLLPFIRWMLAQAKDNKKIPPINNVLDTVLKNSASSIGNSSIQNSMAQTAIRKTAAHAGLTLAQKIAIGVASVVLVSGVGTTAVVLKNKQQPAVSEFVLKGFVVAGKNNLDSEKTSVDVSETTTAAATTKTKPSKTTKTHHSETTESETTETKPSETTETITSKFNNTEPKTTETIKTTEIYTEEEKTTKETTKTTKKTTTAKKEFLSDDYDLFENSYGTLTFENCTASGTVRIPSSYEGTSVTAIGSGAFRNSSATKIYIPSSITSIASSAFDGLWGVTLYCKSGSYAETYAQENEYDYKLY